MSAAAIRWNCAVPVEVQRRPTAVDHHSGIAQSAPHDGKNTLDVHAEVGSL